MKRRAGFKFVLFIGERKEGNFWFDQKTDNITHECMLFCTFEVGHYNMEYGHMWGYIAGLKTSFNAYVSLLPENKLCLNEAGIVFNSISLHGTSNFGQYQYYTKYEILISLSFFFFFVLMFSMRNPLNSSPAPFITNTTRKNNITVGSWISSQLYYDTLLGNLLLTIYYLLSSLTF